MHLRKAWDALWKMAESGHYDVAIFAQASALLDGFSRSGHSDGSELDSYAREKIRNVRSWFAIVCGVGEDFDHGQAVANLMTDLGKLKGLITSDGLHLAPGR